MQINQFCTFPGHSNEPIIGYCMNLECNEIPQYCHQCGFQKHHTHADDCKSIRQMIQFIADYIEMISKLSHYLDQTFNEKYENYFRIAKYFREQGEKLQILEEKLGLQEFEKLTPNLKTLREMYKLNKKTCFLDFIPQNFDQILEILNKFSLTNEEIKLQQNQIFQSAANQVQEVEIPLNQQNIDNKKDIKDQQQQRENQQMGLPRAQQPKFHLNNIINSNKEKNIPRSQPHDELKKNKQQYYVIPCEQLIREVPTLRHFKFSENNSSDYVMINEKQVNSRDHVQQKVEIDKFDKITIFLCEPEIPAKVMAITRFIIGLGYCCIGICDKDLIKMITCLDDLRNKQQQHGFYFIDSNGYCYSNLQDEQNIEHQLGPINNQDIQVEVDRIYHRVIWERFDNKKRFEAMEISRLGKMHLCVGLHSGQIKFNDFKKKGHIP